MLLLGLLLLAIAVPSAASPVFPEGFCRGLPPADPGARRWIDEVAPELGRGPVHVLSRDEAIELFQRAADAGLGSVELFTRDAFRQPCTVFLSRDVLRSVDERFELDLVTAVQGEDEDGEPFAMVALVGGHGKLVAVYDRGGIVYRNEREDRDFGLSSRVALTTPARGRLEDIDGVCAEVALLGCIDIDSMVQQGDTITVTAGPFTADSRSTPIEPRSETIARD